MEVSRAREGAHAQFVAPSVEEVKTYAGMHGVSEDCAVKFFFECDRDGWIGRNGFSMQSWQSGLMAYWSSWRAHEFKNAGRAGAAENPELARLELEHEGEEDAGKRAALKARIRKLRGW